MKIRIDLALCQGHSVCLGEAPEVFDVIDQDDWLPSGQGLAGQPAAGAAEKVMKAAKYCP